jgi:hypothetical protein
MVTCTGDSESRLIGSVIRASCKVDLDKMVKGAVTCVGVIMLLLTLCAPASLSR